MALNKTHPRFPHTGGNIVYVILNRATDYSTVFLRIAFGAFLLAAYGQYPLSIHALRSPHEPLAEGAGGVMILITGATGTNGRGIVEQLSAKGVRARAMVRKRANVKLPRTLNRE